MDEWQIYTHTIVEQRGANLYDRYMRVWEDYSEPRYVLGRLIGRARLKTGDSIKLNYRKLLVIRAYNVVADTVLLGLPTPANYRLAARYALYGFLVFVYGAALYYRNENILKAAVNGLS